MQRMKHLNNRSKVAAPQLVEMVTDARERTLELVKDLADEQLNVPRMEIVNPFLWELRHAAFFYDVFLLRVLGSDTFLLEGAENLYDSFKIDHDDRWDLPLPTREKTLEYMRHVFDSVVGRLDSHEPSTKETYLYLLSILHEDMHGEAFTYMRQTLEYPAPHLRCVRAGDSGLADEETAGQHPVGGRHLVAGQYSGGLSRAALNYTVRPVRDDSRQRRGCPNRLCVLRDNWVGSRRLLGDKFVEDRRTIKTCPERRYCLERHTIPFLLDLDVARQGAEQPQEVPSLSAPAFRRKLSDVASSSKQQSAVSRPSGCPGSHRAVAP